MKKQDLEEYKNLLSKLDAMVANLNKHQYDIAIHKAVDVSWYLQKAETISLLLGQMEESRERIERLQALMQREFNEAKHRLTHDLQYLNY